MKRRAILVICLLGVVAAVTAGFAGFKRGTSSMNVRYNKRDLPEHGIRIITPVDSAFDDLASKHFKKKTPDALKPFSVFVENSTDHTLVAYVLTWTFANQNGRITGKSVAYTEPDILMGEEMRIPPGSKHGSAILPHTVRSFDWQSQIFDDDPSARTPQLGQADSPARKKLSAALAKATDITVALDGGVFDDGRFVGTNTVFFQQMESIVNAKTDLLQEIAEANTQSTLDQALESIKAKSLEPDVQFSQDFSPDEFYRYYRKIYATEIAGMASLHGKAKMIPYLREAHRRIRPIRRMD